jgi:hypothetical protein
MRYTIEVQLHGGCEPFSTAILREGDRHWRAESYASSAHAIRRVRRARKRQLRHESKRHAALPTLDV